jgi:glycosyltransferase A (GT-A) superfamily protein (DUF2064 family)
MNKINSSIYLFPLNAAFSSENVPLFEGMDKEHSSMLYSALTENYGEVFETFTSKINAVYIFDNKDREVLPEKFRNAGTIVFYGDTENKTKMFRNLSEKYFNKFHNNLIIFSNSIGITVNEINQAMNLLSIEDEAFVIGKTSSGAVAFIGFNTYNSELFEEIDWNNFNYDNFLLYASKHDHFLHVINSLLVVKNIEDFKTLYKELSKKESLAYCSQNMHEKFTHLFIEYKDLLK